ncbi:uncharacterized protein KD926_007687 [Aspergillus affinis]|uniref:uncharacterized protein n=1 Tax=Aspergillus affinis TaxID=1070780 RepID=UPI0022FEF57E|nr:uncharacterized protein KD926_007687 [Aspergillus affinis]KAI9040745.1 hypothetical protein KD926_007687 [Aspergillus affinis]
MSRRMKIPEVRRLFEKFSGLSKNIKYSIREDTQIGTLSLIPLRNQSTILGDNNTDESLIATAKSSFLDTPERKTARPRCVVRSTTAMFACAAKEKLRSSNVKFMTRMEDVGVILTVINGS